jgi:hypothetical protein
MDDRSNTLSAFLVEREIEGIGLSGQTGLALAAARSNEAVAALSPHLQWRESWVAADRLYCLYLASDARMIREHAGRADLPAGRITFLTARIDPMTAQAQNRRS